MQQMQLSMGRTLKMPKNVSKLQNPKVEQRGRPLHNLNGQRFTRLFVLGYVGSIPIGLQDKPHTKWSYWLCECDCGNFCVLPMLHLKSGHTQSCGCLHREQLRESSTTHSKTDTAEYNSFHHAKSRCERESVKGYHNYGGRGIEFRFESFEEFYAELGDKPTLEHSLDRINNEGHYEKGNVRWATPSMQNNNQRRTRFITIDGASLCACDWTDQSGISSHTIRARLYRGYCERCAVFNTKGMPCAHQDRS